MHFGLHYQMACGPDQSPMRRYADTIAQAVYGERLGFESVWPAEQHFAPDTSIMPSPLLLLSAIAAFTGTKFSFAGRYHQIENAVLVPRPIQHPHPPIRLAANSAETMRLAGRLALPILVGLHVNTMTGLRDMLPVYREAQREARVARKPDDITVLAPVFTGSSIDEIRRAVTPGVMFLRATLQDKIATWLASVPAGPQADAARARLKQISAGLDDLDFDTMAEGRAIFDTPDGCVDRLRELETELGAGRVVGWFNMGGLLPHRRVLSAMESFAVNVMPRTSRALQLV